MSTDIKRDRQVETKASAYDAVNAFLISSITIGGTLVTIQFLIWLTMLNRDEPQPNIFRVDATLGNEKPKGFEDDLFEPGVEDFPEVEVPQLANAFEALTDAVSAVESTIEARDGDAAEMGKGKGFGSRDGGPGSGGGQGVPEHQRWKIEYDTANITEYTNLLSFFKIEIGVISRTSNEVLRVADPGNAATVSESDRESENQSLYFVHEKQQLRRWDESIARRSGIELRDNFTIQFFPEPTRVILRQAEAQYLQKEGRTLPEVRRTRFKVVEDGSGFRFVVAAVEYQ